MTEEEKDKLITAYLSGRASEAEARQVERSRTQDPAFEVELEEQQTLWRAIGPSRVNEFRKVVAEVMNEQRPKNGGSSFYTKPRIIALAALLLLSVIACWWFFTPGADPQNRLFDQYFSVPAPTAFSRDQVALDNTDAESRLQRAIDSLYRVKAYPEALSRMEEFGTRFPRARSSEFYFLQGMLYLSVDRPEAALRALAEVKVGHPYDKQWYTGLAYLKMGEPGEARTVLGPLAREANPYRAEAAAILEALSE